MNLLGSVSYDPSVAVSKATTSLLAMTAVDTSNLRAAITVPAHGKVYVRLMCTITGATTLPTILLGVMNGATVLGRISPQIFTGTQNATTQDATAFGEFVVTGLTPGAMNVDAAYAVQVVVALTNIKYGGPNNNSGANAWGAFVFEIWDPQTDPVAIAPGAAGGLLIAGSNAATTFASLTSTAAFSVNGVNAVSQTGDSFARLGAPAGASVSADVAAVKAAELTAAQIATGVWQDTTAGDFTVSASIGKSVMNGVTLGTGLTVNDITTKTGYALTSGERTSIATSIWTDATAGDFTASLSVGKSIMNGVSLGTGLTVASVSGAVGSVTGAVGSVTGAVGSVTGNVGGNVVGSVASVTATVAANLTQILGTVLTETSGQIAAAFKKFFNIATPASTMDALTLVATATNLTNAPTSGDLTATMKTSVTTAATAATPTAAAVTGAVGSVTGSVGSISGITFPTHFSSLAIDVSGNVTFGNTSIATVTNLTNAPTSGDFTAAMKTSLSAATPSVTVSDKTGFSLTQSFPTNFASLGISAGGHVLTVDTLTTYTGNTPQTGDVFARVGLAGVGLTNLGDVRVAHLDADISSRLATSGYTAPDNSDIAAIKAKTDNLPAAPADESLIIAATNSLASSIAALPTAATVSAIKSKTDSLTFTIAGQIDANTQYINDVQVNGDGGAGTPWGP